MISAYFSRNRAWLLKHWIIVCDIQTIVSLVWPPFDVKIKNIVQLMSWRQTGNMPLFEPMMGYFTDTYLHHLEPMY